jgi:PKD repeat protein
MKNIILLITCCLFITYGYAEQVEAGSTGNQIVFTLNNISSETISNAVISIENCPDWLTFSSENINIETLNAGLSTTVEFEFLVSSTASGNGNVSFLINSDGLSWNSSSNSELNIPISANPLEEMIANFYASTESGTQGTTIQFYDASSGDPTNFIWSFPGGNPSTSTLQNPTVTYGNIGNYGVTLDVSSNVQSDIETKSNFISIEAGSYLVSGNVKDFHLFTAISGVNVEFIPNLNSPSTETGSVSTDSNGEFVFSVSNGWEGKILLSKSGYQSIERTINPITGNYGLGEIKLTKVVLSFTYEVDNSDPAYIHIAVNSSVTYSYGELSWVEPVSGNRIQIFQSGVHDDDIQVKFDLGISDIGTLCERDLEMCLYDCNDNLIGSCYSGHISYLYEGGPIDDCFNTNITTSFQIDQGGDIFPLGTVVRFFNTSYPKSCIRSSVWFFDNDNAGEDCNILQQLVCDHECKYDADSYYGIDGIPVGGSYEDHEYTEKGNYRVRLYSSTAGSAERYALGCSNIPSGYSVSEKLGNVVIVDCDETIYYSSNFNNAIIKYEYYKTLYLTGSFVLDGDINSSTNSYTTEFVACNSVKMSPGFKVTGASGKSVKMYVHSNLSDGNLKSAMLQDEFAFEEMLNVEKSTNIQFQVYPNPVCEFLNIIVNSKDGAEIQLYDVVGKLMRTETMSDQFYILDVSDLMAGTYMLRVESSGQIVNKKIIKEY